MVNLNFLRLRKDIGSKVFTEAEVLGVKKKEKPVVGGASHSEWQQTRINARRDYPFMFWMYAISSFTYSLVPFPSETDSVCRFLVACVMYYDVEVMFFYGL